MQTITQISPQKKSNRVNIYLDGKFAFGIDLENFIKEKLKVGRELTEKEIKELLNKNEYKRTLDKLLKFATLRPRSEKEIRDWFVRKKVYSSIQQKLFDKLKYFDLVDDTKFAKWWIGQRLQFKKKSKRELYSELRMKGINKEIIGQTIDELLGPEYEVKIAEEILSKRAYKWSRFDTNTAKKKKIQYLSQKGFSWEIINKVV